MTTVFRWKGLPAVASGLMLLVGNSLAYAGPVLFDFVGPRVGSRDTMTFEMSGLWVTFRGFDTTHGGAAKVTQWETGLGVRTDLPNSGNGDGALDSIGADELLEFGFTDSLGRPVDVRLDTLVFDGFSPVDDLTLWVGGVVKLGPDYHPPSATMALVDLLPLEDRMGTVFAISVSDEGPNWEDDYFRLMSMTVFLEAVTVSTAEDLSTVEEPGSVALAMLALVLAGAVGAWGGRARSQVMSAC